MKEKSVPRPAPEQIKPEDCPEPFWHQTHRYCPACSWREEPCGGSIYFAALPWTSEWPSAGTAIRCSLYPGHKGKHEAKVNW